MNEEIVAISDRYIEENVLFVLKGFHCEDVGVSECDLEEVIKNKVASLMQIVNEKVRFVTFDEFVCLYDLVVLQYRKIYVIENPAYMNLYPVNVQIPANISIGLLDHFNEDCGGTTEIPDISEYTAVYSNYMQTDQGIACCYNISDDQLKDAKIERIILPVNTAPLPRVSRSDKSKEFVNLCSDVDYYQLVQALYTTSRSFTVTTESYEHYNSVINSHLEVLCGLFPHKLFSSICDTRITKSQTVFSIPGVKEIMKKYWKFDEFRIIPMYDIHAAEEKQKKVIHVSQEQIVNDIIGEVENCINGENFRDIFVPAPTGAGKSLMFQLPAIYLAKKYKLVTLVISPLIGLMNDQVQSLLKKGYDGVRTINSDIPPVKKQEILDEITTGKCSILYLAPESLLSRSDLEQLIGTRRIGMLVVDEAHIVTTWGKQFRPDYWYLGDHVQKWRRAQVSKEINPSPFIIATFTATAIFEGNEDMYHETLNSLHMIDPISYLGYVRRDNITIEISEVEVKRNKPEYEMNKFDSLISTMNTALMRNQKTLIYFPTVSLIKRFYDYCYSKNLSPYVAMYHGQMEADKKSENFNDFLSGKKLVMIATKAFGMGIDIPDISIVAHFAPTGNVCDYMQEIGRAARDKNIQGYAIYKHMSNDFKYINRLHGLSTIRDYQLVEVIKKVLELYIKSRYTESGSRLTKGRNEMLVDTESFSYIFDSPLSDDNDLINKVKTAMLLIQKDYENRAFAPFHIRPIPLFAYGYFAVPITLQEKMNKCFPKAAKPVYYPQDICEVDLKKIWQKSYSQDMSFPKFKYLLYTRSSDLPFNSQYPLESAMSVDVFIEQNADQRYSTLIETFKNVTAQSIYQGKYFSMIEIIHDLSDSTKISIFRAESIASVFLAAMDVYRKNYSNRMNSQLYRSRINNDGSISYQFNTSSGEFFTWLDRSFHYIKDHTKENRMYIVNDKNDKASRRCKEITTALGILESFDTLRFRSLGGSNSQIYIYVNETKNMQIVRDKPHTYKNRLLEKINQRHIESVRMLTYLFQNNLSSDEVWENLENYFLGILPTALQKKDGNAQTDQHIENVSVIYQVGDDLQSKYSDWKSASVLFDDFDVSDFAKHNIPLADSYEAILIIGEFTANLELAWTREKVAITNGEESAEFREKAKANGWTCIPMSFVSSENLAACF